MYGKIFDSIYDGTLAEDWRALITFQQLIVLCDADGTVDMTPQSISRRTGIPIEHINAGLEILESPDLFSRTLGEEGCRIKLLDEHRPWGWFIVNHEKYKKLKDADAVRTQNRERKQKQRKKEKLSQGVTKGHAESPHTDTDLDLDLDTKHSINDSPELPKIEIINLIPDDYQPDQNFIDRMHMAGITKTIIQEQTETFIAHHQAKKTTGDNWDAEFKLWLIRGKVNGWNTQKNIVSKNNKVESPNTRSGDDYTYYRKLGSELGISPNSDESDKDYIRRVKNAQH